MSRSKWDCLTSLFLAFFIWMNIKKLMFNQYIDLPHVKKKTKDYYINEKRNKRSESFQCVWKNYSFVALRLDVKTHKKKSPKIYYQMSHTDHSHWWAINMNAVEPINFSCSSSWHLQCLLLLLLFFIQHLLFLTCRTSHRRLPINLRLNFDWMWHAFRLPTATSLLFFFFFSTLFSV